MINFNVTRMEKVLKYYKHQPLCPTTVPPHIVKHNKPISSVISIYLPYFSSFVMSVLTKKKKSYFYLPPIFWLYLPFMLLLASILNYTIVCFLTVHCFLHFFTLFLFLCAAPSWFRSQSFYLLCLQCFLSLYVAFISLSRSEFLYVNYSVTVFVPR